MCRSWQGKEWFEESSRKEEYKKSLSQEIASYVQGTGRRQVWLDRRMAGDEGGEWGKD